MELFNIGIQLSDEVFGPSGFEEMVHTDPVGSQVGFTNVQFSSNAVKSCLLRRFLGVFLFFFCSYLHSCDPPIIHGNLTCDTIFIQHNGLIKIGSGVISTAAGEAAAFKNLQHTFLHTVYTKLSKITADQ